MKQEENDFDIENALESVREGAIQVWIKNCYIAFDTVLEEGIDTDDASERMEILTALRKVLALFEVREEYEKCQKLSWILECEFPGYDTTPDRNHIESLGIY